MNLELSLMIKNVLLSWKRRGGPIIFPVSASSQFLPALYNPYARMSYFGVGYSEPLIYFTTVKKENKRKEGVAVEIDEDFRIHVEKEEVKKRKLFKGSL